MADFGSPVANTGTYDPQGGLKSLAQVYGIKQEQAQLKNTQAQLPAIEAQAQQEQQTAQQRAGVAKFFKTHDPNKYVGPDGTYDMNAIAADGQLIKDAGDSAPAVLQALNTIKGQQIQNKQAMVKLNADVTNQFGAGLGSMRTDPRVVEGGPEGVKAVDGWMDNFSKTSPDAAKIVDIYRPMIDKAPPGKLVQMVSNFQLQAQDAASQAGAQKPNLVNTGGQVQNVGAPQSAGGDLTANKPADITLAPTEEIPYQSEKTGSIAQTEKNFQNVSANRLAASSAPQQLDQINKALDISKTVTTGTFTAERGKLESALSTVIPEIQSAKDDATKINLLDKFLTRITNDSNKVLGVDASTDAERESISRQNAQIGYTPEAIQNVLKYAGAQTLAMQAKGDAQESWLKQKGNGITNQQDFETSWRKAYDPKVFQLEEASPAEQVKIIKALSPQEAAELKQKRDALRALGVNIP